MKKSGWTKWNGPKAVLTLKQVNASAAHEALEAVGSDSDQEIPHDKGDAMRSKSITPLSIIERTGVGAISYGGGTGTGHAEVPYVPHLHEIPKNYQRGRKSNFLRDPFNREADTKYKDALKEQAKKKGL